MQKRLHDLFQSTDAQIEIATFNNDLITPVSAYYALQQLFPHANSILLETGQTQELRGHYSYLSIGPLISLESQQQETKIHIRGESHLISQFIFDVARQIKNHITMKIDSKVPKFGLLFGYMTYDAIRLFEDIPHQHKNPKEPPEITINLFKYNIVFDHFNNLVHLIIINHTNDATISANELYTKINTSKLPTEKFSIATKTKENFNSENYTEEMDDTYFIEKINKAKSYIQDGEAFQIVLSRTFNKNIQADPFTIYRLLRQYNPSPYLFYIKHNEDVLLGSSPEMLITVHDNIITTCPLAGTIKKSNTSNEEVDANTLLNDPKEISEHMMLVDLARNDIGRVAKFGSIKPTKLMQIQKHAHLLHISSTIQGELSDSYDSFDALAAAFPAGTLSGAPKIRAMEIIDDLENSMRAYYGGSIFVIDQDGELDSCIAIRMAHISGGIAKVRAGAGIVFDSNPEAEAQETRNKAETLLRIINLAEENK